MTHVLHATLESGLCRCPHKCPQQIGESHWVEHMYWSTYGLYHMYMYIPTLIVPFACVYGPPYRTRINKAPRRTSRYPSANYTSTSAHGGESVKENLSLQDSGKNLLLCYCHEALFVNQGSGSDSAGNTGPDLKPAEGASPSDLLRRRRLSSTGTTSPHLSYQLHVGGWSLTLMCRQAVHAAQRRRHALAASRHVRLLPTTSEPYEPPARAVGVRGYLRGTLRRWKARACACTAGAGGSRSE